MTPSVYPTMEEYYPLEQVRAIWAEIGNLHVDYLELEESPQKLEKRHELEDAIGVFLSVAPHNHKFIFPETANILYRSASTKNFSGYKAAVGFNAIAMYAANLWNQPWRNEYKQIKLYSGYYKHQIDANLADAQNIFELMGYKYAGAEILILDGPVCPDKVVSISQDALVAYVECQVLKAIWEEVSLKYKITWLEVLEFRQSHLCSPKHAVQSLNYLCYKRQIQQHTRSHSQGTDVRYSSASATLPSNHSFPPLYSQSSIPLQYVYNNGYYPNNYSIYTAPHPPLHPYHHNYAPLTYAKPIYNPNCHHPNGYAVPVQSIPQACPTAQLIEVESQHCNESSKSPLSNNEDSWDYVYKDLKNQGYSKDLGERGDLLNNPLDKRIKEPIKEAKKVKAKADDKTLSYLSLNEKRQPTSTLSENGYATHAPKIKTSTNDTTINKTNKTASTQTLKNKKSEDKASSISEETISKWQCATCTYLNDPKLDICEMCSKSKISVCDEMEIGGSQCSKCTLVNPKDNKNCSACTSSLKGSPTYI